MSALQNSIELPGHRDISTVFKENKFQRVWNSIYSLGLLARETWDRVSIATKNPSLALSTPSDRTGYIHLDRRSHTGIDIAATAKS